MESEGSQDCDKTKIMKKSWTQDRLTALCIIILTGRLSSSFHIKHNSSLTPLTLSLLSYFVLCQRECWEIAILIPCCLPLDMRLLF